MEGKIAILEYMVEGLHMTIVYIKVGVRRELGRVLRPCTPFVYSGIELRLHISTKLSYKKLHLLPWPLGNHRNWNLMDH